MAASHHVRPALQKLAAWLTLALLAGCAQQAIRPAEIRRESRPLVDSAPPMPLDLDAIAEPVPKAEPRARYGNHSPYRVFGKQYQVLEDSRGYVARGTASWYGTKFHGRLTSNREPYDMYSFTAAHKTLPLPSYARVTNLENGRSIVVRINDRGPFVGDRLIDLSYVAAVKLGVHIKGTAPVEVRVLEPEDQGYLQVDPLVEAAPATRQAHSEPPAPAIAMSVPAPVARNSAPHPAPVARADAQPPTRDRLRNSGVYLQFGAFSALDNARMLRARLQGAGIAAADVVAVPKPDAVASNSGPWRVLSGPYADRIEALAAQQQAGELGFSGARIVEH